MTDLSLRDLRRDLEAVAEPAHAGPMAAYMKGRFVYLGVKTPARRAASKGLVRAADGGAIDYLVIERAASSDSPATRHVFGVADLGREALLIDAGGPADRFDADALVAFLQSLRVRIGPAPPAAEGARPASPGGSR